MCDVGGRPSQLLAAMGEFLVLRLHNDSPRGRVLVLLLILMTIIAFDQATKAYAVDHLKDAERMSFLGGIIHIVYAENEGAFLSLGETLSDQTRFLVFTVMNGLFLAGIAWYLLWRPQRSRLEFVAFSLLLAGGIGNLIDRIVTGGRVIDFLNVGIGPVRTGIFNVADVAISAAALILLLLYFRMSRSGNSDLVPDC